MRIIVRRFDSATDSEYLRQLRAAWSDLPGHRPGTAEAVVAAIEAFGSGSHSVLLMSAQGEPVGLVRSLLLSPEEGYIDAPGLRPDWRTPANFAALLAIAGSRLRNLGAKRGIMDSWGDPPEAATGWHSIGWSLQTRMPGRRIQLRT